MIEDGWPSVAPGDQLPPQKMASDGPRQSAATFGENHIVGTLWLYLTVCYWKWPFIVDFPIENGDFL